jgi:hypothetical protein
LLGSALTKLKTNKKGKSNAQLARLGHSVKSNKASLMKKMTERAPSLKNQSQLEEEFNNEKILTIRFNKEFFKNNECQMSFYAFSQVMFPLETRGFNNFQENLFRRWCYKMSKHRNFEKLILLLILFSSVKLVVDTYLFENDTKIVVI